MTEALHPDADQLAAFAEQALPAHEREQTLAHLAACSACRAIVFTAQQAQPEEVALPAPATARKPWYAGWNVLWPVAALAGLVLLTVHLRQPQPNAAPKVAKIAQDALPLDTPAPALSAKVTPAASRTEENKQKVGSKTQLGTRGPVALPVPVPPGQHVVLGNASAAQSQPRPADIVVLDQAAMQANAPVPAPPPLPSQARQTSAAPQTSQVQSASPQQFHGYAAAPAQAGQSLQTTTQSNATGVIVDGAAFGSSNATLLPERMLPSGLPLRSSTSDAGRQLAIDSAGALFFSNDGGRTWKTVARAWQGRVVSVSSGAAPSTLGGMLRPSLRAKAMAPATAAPMARSAGESRAAAQIAGTVTDAVGAVIPGATVRAGTERQTVSDASGRFVLAGIAPGSYKVEVSAPGFMTDVREVTLAGGDRVALGPVLQVGAATQTVEVETGAAMATAKPKPPAAFRLTTDAGAVWVSGDGQKWTREK